MAVLLLNDADGTILDFSDAQTFIEANSADEIPAALAAIDRLLEGHAAKV